MTEPTYYINGLMRQPDAATARAYLGIVPGGGFTPANLTEAVSGVLVITGGANAVNGAGTTIEVAKADSTNSGYLAAADWNTFNEKLDDAPASGILYGRLNGAWSAAIPEAPNDGTMYGRLNNAWSAAQPAGSYLTDAPSDGTTYGRNNAAWVAVSSGISLGLAALGSQVFS